MQQARYLERLLEIATSGVEEADAVEYALCAGWLDLTYSLDRDTPLIQRQLPTIVETFRRVADENMNANHPLAELIRSLS